MKTPLILVSNHIESRISPNGHNGFNIPSEPRRDYIEVARRLNGTAMGYDLFNTAWYRWTRKVEHYYKFDLVEAYVAMQQISQHNLFLSTSEKIAAPLSMLLSMGKQQIPHIVIAHKLSSGHKVHLWNVWKSYRTFTHVICLCRAQADYAINHLGISASNVHFVHDKVDHHFFRPMDIETEDFILAVGREQRDYRTLLDAVAGTDIKLVIVPSSPWSATQLQSVYPENVTVLYDLSYQKLRELYAKARLVVVALANVDYAAGVNTLLEAMAMAKPVIVSRTAGIRDYIVEDETALCVTPGEPLALREAILDYWDRDETLAYFGRNARQAVEETMNFDLYVEQIAQIAQIAQKPDLLTHSPVTEF